MRTDPPAHERLTPERFRELAVAELASVHRFALHLTGDAHEAEDLVQHAYVRAFEAWATYAPGPAGMRPWLFKILHNARRSDQRRRRALSVPFDDAHAEPAAPADDRRAPGPGPIDWDRVDDGLRRAIARLPDELREVFLLYAAGDLKYREIAEVLQIPIGTVMSRLSRARAHITRDLDRPENHAGGDAPAQGRNKPDHPRIVTPEPR